MPYIGNQPGTGVRNRFIYTATASQTTFSGADDNGKTLKYADSDFVDVYLNGICLVPVTDYTSTSKTSVVLTQAASLNDTLEVIAYDIATIADTVSKADGGTFEGDLGITNASPDITLTNNTTEDTDGGRESTVTFKGLQSGGEESTLAEIRASHDGTADDQKGDLIFKTNDGSDNAAPTEAMRIDSSQNVGIGTSSPSHLIDGRLSGTSSGEVISVGNIGTGSFGGIAVSDGGTYPVRHWGSSLEFYTGNSSYGSATERMRIDSSGNVNIGVSSGEGTLTVASSGNKGLVLRQNTAADRFKFFVGDGTSGYAVDENFISSDNTNLRFLAGGSGTTEVMQVTSGGAVLIGTTSSANQGRKLLVSDSTSTSSHGPFKVENTNSSADRVMTMNMNNSSGGSLIVFDVNNAAKGSITTNGSAVAYNTSSDYRLKENVTDVTDGITRVKKLQPRRFNWIADETNTVVDGFLAHEAQTIVPEAVVGTKDAMTEEVLYVDGDEIPDGKKVGDVKTASTIDPQGIDQSKLVPLLTAALQEAIAKIETLETKVAALEAE